MGKESAVTLEPRGRAGLTGLAGLLAGAALTIPVSVYIQPTERGECSPNVSLQAIHGQRLDHIEASSYKWKTSMLDKENAFFRQVQDQREVDGSQDNRILKNTRRIDEIEYQKRLLEE